MNLVSGITLTGRKHAQQCARERLGVAHDFSSIARALNGSVSSLGSISMRDIDRKVKHGQNLTFEEAFCGMCYAIAATNSCFYEQFHTQLSAACGTSMTEQRALAMGTAFVQLMAAKESFRSLAPEEIAGMVAATNLDLQVRLELPAVVETSGMGGDIGFEVNGQRMKTINASTLSAFVLDAVRGAGGGGDTSFAGALEALETALEDEEVEAPLEPGRADTIRLMNLHKAKGLEARVVVLAAPFGEREDAPVEHRIERSADGRARGWVLVQKKERWSTRVLARPLGWAAKEAEERAFRLAESFRLLYVASTRAKEELIVARAAEKTGGSLWSRLHPWLDAHGTRLDLVPKAPPPRERLEATAEALQRACRAAAQLRFRAADPTFRFESVTSAVEHPDAVGPEATFLSLDPGDGPGGHAWGSAVHGVLEAAARRASAEHLRSVGRALLLELDRPARGGEPTELDALVETAQSVLSSSLWERSRAAGDAHAEVPFTLLRLGSEPPAYVEGVVDLAFRETDGWVLVDYKTDRGDDPGFPLRHVAYREQLRLYADAWQEITGEPVKERLLWFVRGRRVEVVPPG